jgi:hypothetical protein
VHQVASRASAARNDRSPRAFEKPILQERTIAVNVIQLEAHQFFSRASFPLGEVETGIASSSVQQPTVLFELTLTIKEKPFEMAFAQLLPGQPCTGPFEYVDPDVDAYFAERWPVCLCANGTIHLPPDKTEFPDDLREHALYYARQLLWELRGHIPNPMIPPDQRAVVTGYRREFTQHQVFDIRGARRQSPFKKFVSSEIGEPIGPGVVTIHDSTYERINELVWSPILSFPNRSTFAADKEKVNLLVNALPRHYNSFSEIRDARRHLANSEIKAAVRSAASAVEAYILHLQKAYKLPSPGDELPFDQKIEHTLAAAGRPSYAAIEASRSKLILYLYRARSSMHVGACEYKKEDGTTIKVAESHQAEPLVEAANAFIIWADSLP